MKDLLQVLLLSSLVMVGVCAQEKPASRPALADFMVMNVCVGADDKPLKSVFPGTPQCTRQRDIRVGETAPYTLHNFVGNDKGCDSRLGNVSKENLPVVVGKVTRFVSSYDKGRAAECDKSGKPAKSFGDFSGEEDGASMQWYDDQYGFILGSWSVVSETHWITPNCKQYPNDSRRFFRGWVIGSADAKPGYFLGQSKLVTATPKDGLGGCPDRFNRSFTYWFTEPMTFTGGMNLQAIVSSHYSRASASGLGPGKAEQVERTYWTKEFGLTRWEKWAKRDWVHPRSKKTAIELAASVRETGRCSPPATLPGRISPEFEAKSVRSSKAVFQEQILEKGGGPADWVMTICNDYSNVVPRKEGDATVEWAKVLNQAYWRE